MDPGSPPSETPKSAAKFANQKSQFLNFRAKNDERFPPINEGKFYFLFKKTIKQAYSTHTTPCSNSARPPSCHTAPQHRFQTAPPDSAGALGLHWPFQLCQTSEKRDKNNNSC